MTFLESDLLPISAMQHLAFCERQCALIHLEQQWEENRFTAEGRVLHDRAHGQEPESRGDTRIVRGLRLHSLRLGLVGVADVVEFIRVPDDPVDQPTQSGTAGIVLTGADGRWLPKPVEYKRGKPKPDRTDEVQLCAQVLCLEEMLGVAVNAGAIFYGRPRRRLEVSISDDLRKDTEVLAQRLHELYDAGVTPPAVYGKKCKSCSLLDICQPKATGARTAVGRYVDAVLRQIREPEPDEEMSR